MVRRPQQPVARLIPALACLLCLSGCLLGEPIPPGRIDAVLALDPTKTHLQPFQYDATVMVSVDSVSEYGRRRKGYWDTFWHLCTTRVLCVLEGSLDEKTLRFTFSRGWPTPESGIMLKMAPELFRKGAVLALSLKMDRRPYKIVFCQERIWQANTGTAQQWEGLGADVNRKITLAVEQCLGYKPSVLIFEGETDTAYLLSDGPRRWSVHKETFTPTRSADKIPARN